MEEVVFVQGVKNLRSLILPHYKEFWGLPVSFSWTLMLPLVSSVLQLSRLIKILLISSLKSGIQKSWRGSFSLAWDMHIPWKDGDPGSHGGEVSFLWCLWWEMGVKEPHVGHASLSSLQGAQEMDGWQELSPDPTCGQGSWGHSSSGGCCRAGRDD